MIDECKFVDDSRFYIIFGVSRHYLEVNEEKIAGISLILQDNSPSAS